MRVRGFVPWLALLLFGAAAAADPAAPGIPRVRVEVTRQGGLWNADINFDRPFAAWVFPRSDETRDTGRQWRQDSWRVVTSGVRLERRGHYDVLSAVRGELPLKVSVRFEPESEGLQGDHAPALIFTDGSVALFVAQFDGFPAESLAAVSKLPRDLNNQLVLAADIKYVFRDSVRPVLIDGRRSVTGETTEPESYVLFGAASPVETADMVGIIDPQLPDWIHESLTRAIPALIGRYTLELGPLRKFKPTLLVTWEGATPGISSRDGSTLRGLIAMRYSGAGMLKETVLERQTGLWFIAHEAAHFWLGQTVGYEFARDAWITEGGAELLAFRAVAEADPDYDPRIPLNRAIDDCIRLTDGRGVQQAGERGERRAYYACGAVFALVAESASGRPFYKFVRQLIDANRADGTVSRAEWLAAFNAATRKPDLGRDIVRLLERGAADPGEIITDLLERAGVNFEVGPAGIPQLR